MADLGKAYIQIIPSAKGIKGNLEKTLDGEMADSGAKAGVSFSTGFGKVMKVGGKVALAAVGAAATGIGIITKQAVSSYAEQEQLVGGIQTLYKGWAGAVENHAREAFKTAGMSANEYMETVTNFSASLIQSVGGDTAKAAEIADTAIRDMSDNANKMGTSMESIQNAYQGFAKQNYTMLDNLKLGYGGTKEEMQRLLEDAEKITGIHYDITQLDDVYGAIHVIQEELGITGTTAEEAMGTISGSIGMTKAAWDNLVTGIADPNANLDFLINDLINSAQAAVENLTPIVTKALSGIGTALAKIAPIIADELPGLVESLLPNLLSAVTSLVNGVVAALPPLLTVIADQAPDIINSLVEGILGQLPALTEASFQILLSLSEGITKSLPTLTPTVVDIILQIVNIIMENLGDVLNASNEIIIALTDGIVASLPKLLTQAPIIIQSLVNSLNKATPLLLSATVQITNALAAGLIENLPLYIDACIQIITTIANGLIEHIPEIITAAGQIIDSFCNSFGEIDWGTLGTNIISGIVSGISASASSIAEAAKKAAQSALDSAKSLLGIKSPSRVFRDQVGKMIGKGMAEGIEDSEGIVDKAMNSMANSTLGTVTATVNSNANNNVSPAYDESYIAQAQLAEAGGDIIIPVYIGQQQIERIVVNALNKSNYRSGGR